MKSWLELYKKEIYANIFFTTVVSILVLVWELFLFYKLNAWPAELVFGLSFVPFGFFPFLMLWQGYHSFNREWKDETIYFLLSLPRSGWQLTLSKLSAGMTVYTAISIFTMIIIYFVNQNQIYRFLSMMPEFIDWFYIIKMMVKVLLGYLVLGLAIFSFSQFSNLISQFYNRFRGLISIVVYMISVYLVYRVGYLLSYLLEWLPDIPVQGMFNPGNMMQKVYIGSGSLIGSLIVLTVIFLTGSWLLENHLEV